MNRKQFEDIVFVSCFQSILFCPIPLGIVLLLEYRLFDVSNDVIPILSVIILQTIIIYFICKFNYSKHYGA